MDIRKISWLPAVIIMGIIFYFSSMPADDSGKNSMSIANELLNIYEKISDTHFVGEERIENIENLDHIIRKLSHFIEYGALAFTFVLHFWIRNMKSRRFFLLSILFTAFYAATDEFHQLFVPGRSGEFMDVLIDSSGAAAGAFFFYLITLIFFRKKRSQKIKSNW
jgi:VanZ family protein